MKISFSLFVLFFSSLVFLSLGEESDVVVLTESAFSDFVRDNENAFVEFYAPWCGHCQHLAPEWEKLATSLKGKVSVAKVDCTTETSVCNGEGVQGYPTIKFFKKGRAVDYQGGRTAEAMTNWAEKKLGDPFTTVSSSEQYTEVTQRPVILGYFSSKSSPVFKDFTELASTNDELSFAAVFDSSVTSDFKEDTVRAFPHNEHSQHYSAGSEFATWVSEYGYPLVDKLGQHSYGRAMNSGKKNIVILFAPQVEPKETLKVLETVASAYRKDVAFLWDLGEQYASHAPRLGITGTKFPVLVGMDLKEKFYPGSEDEEFTAETVKAFIDNLLAGKVSPNLQSEEIPEDNSGPVKIVVGKNYKELVVESKEDVFLEVYAPWCGHCKKLAPVWDELGAKYQGKVVIAKVDGTANDIPERVSGYPTLLFFKAGDKENPITFEGDRTLEELSQFVEQHSSAKEKDEL